MWKKILIGLVSLIAVGCLTGMIVFIVKYNKQVDLTSEAQLQAQQFQATLASIGEMTTVWTVNNEYEAGDTILDSMLIQQNVPVASLGANISIVDKTDIVGKYFRVDIHPGTTITKDLIMDVEAGSDKYNLDLVVDNIPIDTEEGDYINLNVTLPTGEDFVVISHKRVEMIQDHVIKIFVSEEEYQCYIAARSDFAMYEQYGLNFYVTKYTNPGVDTDTVPWYPVLTTMEEMINTNPNIFDKSRCINSDLRKYIDYQLYCSALEANDNITSLINRTVAEYNSVVLQAYDSYNQYKEQQAEADAQNAENQQQLEQEQAAQDAVDSGLY